MAVHITSTATFNSTQVQEILDRRLIMTLHEQLQMMRYAVLRPQPANEGQTVSWRKFAKLTPVTTALTEGVAPAGGALTITEITALMEQYGDFIEMSDWLDDTGIDPIWMEAQVLQGRQAALTFDTLIQTKLLAATNVHYGGDAVSTATLAAGDFLTLALLDDAIVSLRNRHVPFVTSMLDPRLEATTVPGSPAYLAFVNPDIWGVLKGLAAGVTSTSNLNQVISSSEYGTDATRLPGEVGKYDQIRFLETTTGLVNVDGGVGPIDTHFIPIIGPEAYAVANLAGRGFRTHRFRPGTQATTGNELAQVGSTGWIANFVSEVLDEDQLQGVEFVLV